jgi:hypothetical protein
LVSLRSAPQDILVSIGVVSLFSRVPIMKTMNLLSPHFEDDIPRLFRHVPTDTYISFAGRFYEYIDDVTMGSPLSPVITNLFMEDFEEMALKRAAHKLL